MLIFGGVKSVQLRDFWNDIDSKRLDLGVNPKLGGFFSPKMDGENNGKPYEQMDDFGGENPHIFWKHPFSEKEKNKNLETETSIYK